MASIVIPDMGSTGVFMVNVGGLVPGTSYSFRAYATNGVGTSYSATGNFTTWSLIETWRETWYGVTTNTGNAADDADPHRTGIPNLVVFAFLGSYQDPAKARLSQLPRPRFMGGGFGYAFSEPDGVVDLTYGAEASPDLAPGSWRPVADSGDAMGFHAFAIPAGPAPHGFIRLKVSRP
jgi:hypothetical protein